MKIQLPITLLALAALTLTPACDKKAPTQNPEEKSEGELAEGDDSGDDSGGEALPALPPQDPDPAEIAALYARYLAGDYEAVLAEAEALRGGLREDTQVRAHGMAAALAALAAVEGVAEQAQEAANDAVRDAERLDDAELSQLAHIAHGLYQVRIHEAAAGEAEIAGALEGPYAGLANIALAEAHLNQAYGIGGEGEEIVVAPGRFDDAGAAYEAASSDPSVLIQAQAHEGLAGVAKYKGDKDGVCLHAQHAEDLFASGGADPSLREVPSLLAKGGRCKDFKKAE